MEILVFILFSYLALSPDGRTAAFTRGAAGAVRGMARHAAAAKRSTAGGPSRGGQAGGVSAVRAAGGRPGIASQTGGTAPAGSMWNAARVGWTRGAHAARERRAAGQDVWSRFGAPAVRRGAAQAGAAWGWTRQSVEQAAARHAWLRSPGLATAGVGGVATVNDLLNTPKSTEGARHAGQTPTPADPASPNVDPSTRGQEQQTTPAPTLDPTATSTPVVLHGTVLDPDSPTALTWTPQGYLSVVSTITDQEHRMSISSIEVTTLGQLKAAATAMRTVMEEIIEQHREIEEWASKIPDEWGKDFGNAKITSGVSSTADAALSWARAIPEGVLTGLDEILAGVAEAEQLAEVAANQSAHGDVQKFQE